jgi:hypothetical protein
MKRPNLNLLVDILALVLAMLVVVTGFVLEYVLPPGSGRLETEGFALAPGAMHKSILLLWG